MRVKERATRQAQNLPTVSTKTGAIGSRILCDPMAPTSFLKQSESKQRPVLRSISARSISHRRGDETLLSCDAISASCPLKAGFWFPRDGAKKRPPWGHKDQESERRLGPLLCRGPLLLSWTCLLASMIDCKRNRCGRTPLALPQGGAAHHATRQTPSDNPHRSQSPRGKAARYLGQEP